MKRILSLLLALTLCLLAGLLRAAKAQFAAR